MTEKLYLAEPNTLNATATVIDHVVTADGRTAIRLNRTVFHPQGGGQKADRDRIGSANVLHVAHNAGDVDHVVDRTDMLPVGATVALEVDADWRRLNAVYHTAGHLLAAVVESMFPGARAVSGHQWPGEARVEFEGLIPADALETIEAHLSSAIAHAWPVAILGQPYEDRSIGIGSMPSIPCGGTHVSALSEIDSIQIKSLNSKKGRMRISYEAVCSS